MSCFSYFGLNPMSFHSNHGLGDFEIVQGFITISDDADKLGFDIELEDNGFYLVKRENKKQSHHCCNLREVECVLNFIHGETHGM